MKIALSGKTGHRQRLDQRYRLRHCPRSRELGRAATTEEVANMVVYVVSPQASATTGAALRVDGGVIDSIV